MLSALWACPILSNLTALLHALRTAQCRKGLSQGCAERGLWQWYKTRPLFVCTPVSAHLHMWHSAPCGKCATVRRKGTTQCWDNWETCFTVQLTAHEQLQSCRSPAQALQTAQVPDPDEGLDPVTPVPGTGIPCYSHAVSPTASVEGKKLI